MESQTSTRRVSSSRPRGVSRPSSPLSRRRSQHGTRSTSYPTGHETSSQAHRFNSRYLFIMRVLFEGRTEGLTRPEIEKMTGLSRETVQRLVKTDSLFYKTTAGTWNVIAPEPLTEDGGDSKMQARRAKRKQPRQKSTRKASSCCSSRSCHQCPTCSLRCKGKGPVGGRRHSSSLRSKAVARFARSLFASSVSVFFPRLPPFGRGLASGVFTLTSGLR